MALAKQNLEESEAKYRSRFEGRRDAIAILDSAFTVRDCNPSAVDFFHLERWRDDIQNGRGPDLADLLFKDEQEMGSLTARLAGIIEGLRTTNTPLEVPALVKGPVGEPRSCTFRFELIRFQDKEEIMLMAISDFRNELGLAAVEGRMRYDIENTLAAADWASLRACENLRAYSSFRIRLSCLEKPSGTDYQRY